MIQMPKRSVTRFFIPLIDVLILLFCIFLLLEYNSESKFDQQSADVELQAALDAKNIQTLIERGKEFEKYEKLLPQLTELEKLREEVERLRGVNQQNLQDRAMVMIIDIQSKDGSISWYDENSADMPIVKIEDAKSAKKLFARHLQEAKGREVYYYFMPPRPLRGYPTAKQMRTYREWFAKTANSLAEKR
jgi:chromatin segregation and condensation protein Rec8/ScpA/Scc1 (kleisin family)